MKSKMLMYCWGSASEQAFCEALQELQIEYLVFSKEIKNYHSDADFAREMILKIHEESINSVFSIDYFPLIAMLCEINKIPYISWIYDCPHNTLWSKTLISPYNYIFCFDRMLTVQLQNMGAKHCEHYPLAANLKMLKKAEEKFKGDEKKFICDVSFVGNLYNGENNRFRKVELLPYTAGYMEGLIRVQQQMYGCNVIREALQSGTMVKEVLNKCQLFLSKDYFQKDLQLVVDALGIEVSAREREAMLQLISQYFSTDLYTASTIPETLKNGELKIHGYVSYDTELPLIYQNSKINLNFTLKTIESGIPQRIFDILACGGFCITNYQPEIAEFFVDGQDLVMYYSEDDLLQKISYYLEHEEERQEIAKNGCRKVESEFLLVNRVRGIWNKVFG